MKAASDIRYNTLQALQLPSTTDAESNPSPAFSSMLKALASHTDTQQALPQPLPAANGHTSPATTHITGSSRDSDAQQSDLELEGGYIPLDAAESPARAEQPQQNGSLDVAVQCDPPWAVAAGTTDSHLLQLHNELVALYSYLTPTAAETRAREATVQRVREVVASIWPEAHVAVFGSYATGLYLPTSDIDLVILGSNAAKSLNEAQRALASAVTRRGLGKNVVVISRAKVPLVKFDDINSGVSIDISFDVANGPEAAAITRDLMDELPPMRPLVMLLKVFLQQRELNEVYTGGLGSYALMVLVAAFLANHPSRCRPHQRGEANSFGERSLGVLSVDLLRLYGRAFNTQDVGVSLRNGFVARCDMECDGENSSRWVVEDPANTQNNLAGGSYAIFKVRQAFDYAYQALIAPKLHKKELLLSRVVRLDPIMWARRPDANPFANVLPHDEDLQPARSKQSKRKKKKHRKRERDSSMSVSSEDTPPRKRHHRQEDNGRRHKSR